MRINSVKVFTSSSELCPQFFCLAKKTWAKATALNYTLRFLFIWWIWWTSCYWREQRRCQNHSLESFHGIHNFCQERDYLWYSIKGPSASVNVPASFMMGTSILPVGKTYTYISFTLFFGFFFFFFLTPDFLIFFDI